MNSPTRARAPSPPSSPPSSSSRAASSAPAPRPPRHRCRRRWRRWATRSRWRIMTCSSLRTCTPNSWTVGTTASVNSHASRLRGMGAQLTTYNNAVTSVKAAGLPAQAIATAAQGRDLRHRADRRQRRLHEHRRRHDAGGVLRRERPLRPGHPGRQPRQPDIFVSSIPNIKRLWEVNRTSYEREADVGGCSGSAARCSPTRAARPPPTWRAATPCRHGSTSSTSSSPPHAPPPPKCVWDNYAVANYTFTRADISTRDYFHPSLTGQAVLANVTWAASQWVR